MFTRTTVVTFEKFEKCSYLVPDEASITDMCDQCQRLVTWLTPNQSVAVTGLTLRELFRAIEANNIHFNETTSGLLLICPNSLEPGLRRIKGE